MEAWWSQLRRYKTGWWIDLFKVKFCDYKICRSCYNNNLLI